MKLKFINKQVYDKLSKTDIKIANYIEKNPDKVRTLTSSKLALDIGVGQSSVIKFIKKIGYAGYTEFRVKLGMRGNKIGVHKNISLDDTSLDVVNKVVENHLESLKETRDNLDVEMINSVVELISNSRRVVLLSLGASSLVAKDFQHKLTKIGVTCLHDLDTDVQLTQVITSTKKDLVIAISHSGETSHVIKGASLARDMGVEVVSITGSSMNTLSNLTKNKIFTIPSDDIFRSSALSSRIAQLAIIDILFIEILKGRPKALKLIDESRRVIKNFL